MQKSKYVFLEDIGDWYITGEVTEMDSDKVEMFLNQGIMKISDLSIQLIKLAQEDNNLACIKKDITTREIIEPEDVVIVQNKSKATPEMALRTTITGRVNQKIRKFLSADNQLHLFEYNVLNSWFNSKGFFITQENKQEVYIKIVEEDDDEMLDNLERLLEAEKQLSMMYDFYKRSQLLFDDIKYLITVDEINARYSSFIKE